MKLNNQSTIQWKANQKKKWNSLNGISLLIAAQWNWIGCGLWAQSAICSIPFIPSTSIDFIQLIPAQTYLKEKRQASR